MEIYRLDADFRNQYLVEDFESCVWTDRWDTPGDFKLVLKSHHLFTEKLNSWKFLGSSVSNRVMMIETADIQKQTDQFDKVTLTGRSIEAMLEHRDNKRGDAKQPETVTGTVEGQARFFVNKYCVNEATAGAVNVIPKLSAPNLGLGGPTVTDSFDRGNILTIVQNIAQTYGYGFGIIRSMGDLLFMMFDSEDYSDPSNTLLYKEYSADNDTLLNISSLESISNYKNHARVLGNKAGVDVYAAGTPSSVSGFDRRTIVLTYSVGDDTTTIAQDEAVLRSLGKQALASRQYRYGKFIEGEIPQVWDDVSFGLGNIVMTKDNYGIRAKARISEQVWTSDANGTKYLPTFEALD